MKAYRLDNVDWYDSKLDEIRCLECGEWFKSVTGHLKVHRISVKEYKQKYNILPRTPLMCKEVLMKSSLKVKKMQSEGKFRLFKHGETSIPKSYRDNPVHFFSNNAENTRLVSKGLRGKRKSLEHIDKMRENASKQDPTPLIAFRFKKGHIPHNKHA